MKKDQASARQGKIRRESGVYTGVHEHFEPGFNAVSRRMGRFQLEMIGNEPYNKVVRDCFENPDHAGDLQGEYAQVLTSEVMESEQGARIVLSAGIADGMIAQMCFRAWGCPHVIAAAEMLCRDRENGPVSGLSAIDANGMMEQLSVPVEKTGKILLLEDALKSLWEQHGCAA